jgi:hypothetical protein
VAKQRLYSEFWSHMLKSPFSHNAWNCFSTLGARDHSLWRLRQTVKFLRWTNHQICFYQMVSNCVDVIPPTSWPAAGASTLQPISLCLLWASPLATLLRRVKLDNGIHIKNH